MATVRFLKCFHTGSVKINIFKVLFWEGGREGGRSQKEYSVYAFDNVDNYGRPIMPIVQQQMSVT